MPKTNYIGLMSGTSLDGVDAVLVSFKNDMPKLLASHSHPISKDLQKKLANFTSPTWQGSFSEIGTLHQQLGKLFADACNTLILKSEINPKSINAIGSHGQTMWHQPEGKFPFSLQLGDANLIAEETGITTIADFRSRDIAAGGQGAPLVPAFHNNVFTHPQLNRVILNIGGIANISILPSKESNKPLMGYDTGPGNGLLDAWIYLNKEKRFDKKGGWARSGSIQSNILETLLNEPYFSFSAPKSTGKELFNINWLRTTLKETLNITRPEDIQATLTELTARTIADDIDRSCDELFICGGGIHNEFLIERLTYHLPNIAINSTTVLGIDPDWMEAIAFSWLARQTIQGKTSNLPLATGAKGSRVLGAIYSA